jgi:aminoglycoside N3'-acetyltransferase
LGQVVMRSREQLEKDFRALGVAANDIVMLHASVRAVGDVAGGPDQIHLALKDVLTTEGALIMYASCPRYYDEVGRGHLTKELEEEILEKLPAFDPLAARSDRDSSELIRARESILTLLALWSGESIPITSSLTSRGITPSARIHSSIGF